MDQAIRDFPKQFKFNPKIQNGPVKKYKKFVVAGMGGSHLAADILKTLKPELDILIWPNYDLPPGDWKKTLLIASSYSGNTEETISAFEKGIVQGLPVIAIATGGKLIELAKENQVPYIQMPSTGIQPRSALGFSLMALLKVMKEKDLLAAAHGLSQILRSENFEQLGKALAQKISGHVPVIYSSARIFSVAYNWKIKFNETGKIPAFCNVFPELNHNEMTGFSAAGGPASGGDVPNAKSLSEKFHLIFLKDHEDHPKIMKRMEITAKLYQDRGLPVEILESKGDTRLERIFSSLLLADWAAYYTAQNYGLDPEQVLMAEEFKRLIGET